VLGGVRIYFGQHDKTLIDRHRQDDPVRFLPVHHWNHPNWLQRACEHAWFRASRPGAARRDRAGAGEARCATPGVQYVAVV
jgi:hypothetical protein